MRRKQNKNKRKKWRKKQTMQTAIESNEKNYHFDRRSVMTTTKQTQKKWFVVWWWWWWWVLNRSTYSNTSETFYEHFIKKPGYHREKRAAKWKEKIKKNKKTFKRDRSIFSRIFSFSISQVYSLFMHKSCHSILSSNFAGVRHFRFRSMSFRLSFVFRW